jgi:hypothetical protein
MGEQIVPQAAHLQCQILTFLHYNFGRIHQSPRVTSAMEADISDRVWSLEEIARLLD